MIAPPVPPNEHQRLEAVRRYDILDSPPEQAFERITALATRVFDVPIALISLLDRDRQWLKACIGLDVRQTDRNIAFCAHAILEDTPLVVPDATKDERFAGNPLVTGAPGIRFYAGAPLRSADGFNLGTVCIIDTKPRSFGGAACRTLEDLAGIVVDALELRMATRRLVEEVKERAATESRLAELVSRDVLTGLHNRTSLNQRLESACQDAGDRNQRAVLYLDLDSFKIVNDTLGHGAGDRLLIRIARLLESETRPTDMVARFGGDEFVIFLDDVTEAYALEVAERIRANMEKLTFSESGKTFNVGASIGVALVRKHSDREQLLADADAACYAAKARGRNRIELFRDNAAEIQRLRDETDLVAQINEVLRNERVQLWLQPVVNLETGVSEFSEALLRLVLPDASLLMPDRFLPIAMRFGLMEQIDQLVVKHALGILSRHPDLRLFINLSAKALNNPALLGHFQEAFAAAGISSDRVIFEITETEIIRNITLARELIEGLREAGFRFALDDFGSGVSNLAYLKSLPLDYLKIDGTFIRGIHTERVYRGFVRAIVEVASYLGVKTVAEFVEGPESLAVLMELGVDYGQGYHFGKPQPES